MWDTVYHWSIISSDFSSNYSLPLKWCVAQDHTLVNDKGYTLAPVSNLKTITLSTTAHWEEDVLNSSRWTFCLKSISKIKKKSCANKTNSSPVTVYYELRNGKNNTILKGLAIVDPDEVCGLRNRWRPQVKQRKGSRRQMAICVSSCLLQHAFFSLVSCYRTEPRRADQKFRS